MQSDQSINVRYILDQMKTAYGYQENENRDLYNFFEGFFARWGKKEKWVAIRRKYANSFNKELW